jgi:hypothetical protein
LRSGQRVRRSVVVVSRNRGTRADQRVGQGSGSTRTGRRTVANPTICCRARETDERGSPAVDRVPVVSTAGGAVIKRKQLIAGTTPVGVRGG